MVAPTTLRIVRGLGSRVGVVLVVEALADAGHRRGEAVGAERLVAVTGHLDALDEHRVDLDLLDLPPALERAAQRGQDLLGSADDADVVGHVVDGAAVGRHGKRERDALELLFLKQLEADAHHPVQRTVAAVGHPVARAAAQEVAQDRLDRVDVFCRVDLAVIAEDSLQLGRAVGPAAVLATPRIRDDADVHGARRRCKKRPSNRPVSTQRHDLELGALRSAQPRNAVRTSRVTAQRVTRAWNPSALRAQMRGERLEPRE